MNDVRKFVRRFLARRRARANAARLKAAHVGEHTLIAASVQVYGWSAVRIGANSMICDDTLINALNFPSDQPVVIIGSHCFIGRRNFFTAGPDLRLGDYTLTGPDCHFLGAQHDYESPFVPYAVAACTGESISLGVNCWLGARVTVLKGVRIGHGSIIGAGSLVTHAIPPFSIAVGIPAQVIKRFEARQKRWVNASDFPADGDAHLPEEADYLATLRLSHPAPRLPADGLGLERGDF